MQTHGSTNKSPIKLSTAKIKLTRWLVYEWGKPTQQKPHQVILRSPLLKLHYYHNKRLQVKESQYLIPTYSWTLTPIPNWTCSVVTVPLSDARLPSMWLTNCANPSMCERPRPRPVLWCWAKPTWMGGVVLLPLKMDPFYDVGPNPREWVESCYCLSK